MGDEGAGELLCSCEFSLGYGGRILLNGAVLRLRRGRRYGLCGANGAGEGAWGVPLRAGAERARDIGAGRW
jgi:hypothetical protein